MCKHIIKIPQCLRILYVKFILNSLLNKSLGINLEIFLVSQTKIRCACFLYKKLYCLTFRQQLFQSVETKASPD